MHFRPVVSRLQTDIKIQEAMLDLTDQDGAIKHFKRFREAKTPEWRVESSPKAIHIPTPRLSQEPSINNDSDTLTDSAPTPILTNY